MKPTDLNSIQKPIDPMQYVDLFRYSYKPT